MQLNRTLLSKPKRRLPNSGPYTTFDNISDEFEDPKYRYVDENDDVDGDILILDRKDLELLEQKINLLKESDETALEKWYIAMLEAIANFMRQNPAQAQFILEGEF